MARFAPNGKEERHRMRVSRRIPRISLALLLLTPAALGTVAAQKPTPRPKPVSAPTKPTVHAASVKTPRIPMSFTDIAPKLSTTPSALETQFEAARATNRKLTRGEFITADVVAQDLAAKNPAITLQALLSGLKSDKNLNKTLVGLGFTRKQADDATDAAEREIKAADKAARKAAKEAKEEAKEATKDTKKPDKDDLPKPPKKPDSR
jgi:hypothetical protein